jgi:hypothetical protein
MMTAVIDRRQLLLGSAAVVLSPLPTLSPSVPMRSPAEPVLLTTWTWVVPKDWHNGTLTVSIIPPWLPWEKA